MSNPEPEELAEGPDGPSKDLAFLIAKIFVEEAEGRLADELLTDPALRNVDTEKIEATDQKVRKAKGGG